MPESSMVSEGRLSINPPATFSAVMDCASLSTTSSSSSTPSAFGSPKPARDSSWLQMDLCRDFLRDTCPRGHSCRFAHPESKAVLIKEGKVTCCYDFLKDRCQRSLCKYYHPPGHIKEKLVCAGKQFGAMMSTTSGLSSPVMSAATPPAFQTVGASGYGPDCTPTLRYPDRIRVCHDYNIMGYCPDLMCANAHPGPSVRHNADQSVTVCHNFMRWGCTRGDGCHFYHPPPHQVLGPMPIQGFYQPEQGLPAVPVFPVQPPLPTFCPLQPFPCSTIPTSPVAMPSSGLGFMPPLPAGSVIPVTPPHLVSPSLAGHPYMPPPHQMFAIPVSVIESALPDADSPGKVEHGT